MIRTLPITCGALLGAVAVCTAAPAEVVAERIEGAKPRNVVFILTDDHRFDAMSFMGHPFLKTPTSTRWPPPWCT